jgi:hypothetical protein
MKKILAILILFLYFSLSAIQVVSIHLCHGQFESIALTTPSENCCTGMHTSHSSCCEDIVIDVDFDADHIYSSELTLNDPDEFDLFFSLLPAFGDELAERTIITPLAVDTDPPPPELFKLQSAYLFYG